jgi:formylmethanofuran dehydrogenase subunit E
MNPEDMVNFIKSLNPEQMAQFQQVFKTIGDTMGVETEEQPQREETVSSSSKSSVTEDFRVIKSKTELERGRTPVRAKKNSWKDTGEFQLEDGEEWGRERKRSTRARQKAQKVEIDCSVCGRTFMEHPSLIYGEYHRCNRCGGK